MSSSASARTVDAVAVVAMTCRFPGAASVEEFWQNLRSGKESISRFGADELAAAGIPAALYQHPRYVPAASVLGDVSQFDPDLFEFTPREAALADPQHRLFLECAWEALELGGYAPERFDGRIGVFAGSYLNTYAISQIYGNAEAVRGLDPVQLVISVDKDYLATLVSHRLNLRGPSLSVQTACSTSLVAVHLACQQLLTFQCDLALAGGVTVAVPQDRGYLYQPGGIMSPDGHCRPFARDAGGTVFGSGVGVVVLRRLEDALADGDEIEAVILGSAMNNDGARKVGFTAPGVSGQAEVIAAAQASAEVEPRSIGYVEAHGTGTALGDPIEIAALERAFGREVEGSCAIGSVKGNIGHLNVAAGVAGLIKAVLVVRQGEIPPSLHCAEANPRIDFSAGRFRVVNELEPWQGPSPRRAGVSSFGIGGTNAHLVLEEPPVREPEVSTEDAERWRLLVLSAGSESALNRASDRLADHLEAHRHPSVDDVAWTLQVGRAELRHRRAVVCRGASEGAQTLRERRQGSVWSGARAEGRRSVAFLFPGQGAQEVGMGKELYQSEAVFRRQIEGCAEILRGEGLDLLETLWGESASERLAETRWAQPALFAVEYSLAQLWISWGIRPEAFLGHSLGEYVAACLAGTFELDEALPLVALRGRLMQDVARGAMLSVALDEPTLSSRLGHGCEIAAINGPALCVVSGGTEGVETLERELLADGVSVRRLRSAHGFHSSRVEPILAPFGEAVVKCRMRAPAERWVSNLTGAWIEDHEAADPAYWVRHCRQPIRFAAGISRLLDEPGRILLEVGPGRTLATLARSNGAGPRDGREALSSMAGGEGEAGSLHAALGRLWIAGVEVDWVGYRGQRRARRVRLPTYPFERRRCWIERAASDSTQSAMAISVGTADAVSVSRGAPADVPRSSGLAPYRAPSGELERTIVSIWSEALGVPQLGVDDNFLELGGHSLLAAQLIGRLREALRLDLPLDSLFENPTVAALARFAESLQGSGHQIASELPEWIARPKERHQPFPLTDVQQAYWIGRSSAFELGEVASHMYWEVESAGLSVSAFERAWQRLVARHDMLRAVILPNGLQQVLADVPPYRLATVDLRRLEPAGCERTLLQVRVEMSHQVLASDRWPIFDLRATLLPGGICRLHLSFDFLLCDAMSFGILGRELQILLGDPAAALPALEIGFRDVVLAEIAFRRSATYSRALAYWQVRIASLPPAPELPLARPPSALGKPRFVRRRASLSAEVWSQLKDRAARYGLSPSGVLAAAFAEVLAVWSKNPRFTLNLTLLHRIPVHPQVGAVVGDFTSLVLLEVDGAAGATFEERARALRRQLSADLEHRYVSGVEVMRELGRARGSSAQAFMPVVFTSTLNVVRESAAEVTTSAPAVQMVYSISQAPQVWLDHQVFESGGQLSFNWDAVEDLFPTGLLDDMWSAYRSLLERLARDPAAWTSAEAGLTPAEHLALFARANSSSSPVSGALLHSGFLARAAERPHDLAVIAGDKRLSYAELARLARAWAVRLRAHKAGANRLVAVAMEKGWEQVVAVLGVLEAGAAYLPVDPALPALRFRALLERGGVEIVLTQPPLVDSLDWPAAVRVLSVDDEEPEIGGADAPVVGAMPEDLAYVIFTSGSTGQPKGVMIDHRGAVNTIEEINRRFSVGASDRVLALSSLSFDLSVYDIFGVLAAGGAIVIPEPGAAREPERWYDLIERHRVSLWNSVPALLEMLVEHLAARSTVIPSSLRAVLLSGDWIPLSLPGRLRALASQAEIVSLGGATEGSIWSILYPIAEVDPTWRSIPYGRPLTNQSVHVLDHRLEPCPVWVTGQLYIGGLGVALGYWSDAERTEASFLIHPRTGERLYRTGDLGRRLPDGDIEFLGREDLQIKVQGYRIELGEIEVTLAEHPAVKEAVVAGFGERIGPKRLTAYVVPDWEVAGQRPVESKVGDRLADWSAVFDRYYGEQVAVTDPALNLAGWTSSFTGQEIPAEEMLEWRDRTVERILDLKPERVLEIGCGVGMLLLRIAPFCRSYVGTDFSAEALRYVERELAAGGGDRSHVRLELRPAEDLAGLGTFDAVIINSVVQYFPDVDYLLDVLDRAVGVVEPDGFVFVGDVRDLRWSETFHVAAELAKAPAILSMAEVRRRAQRRAVDDEELSIDPELFAALPARFALPVRVDLHAKSGKFRNEMNRFRYDVVLRVGAEPESVAQVPRLDGAGWDLEKFRAELGSRREPFVVGGLCDSRNVGDARLAEILATGDPNATAGTVLDPTSRLQVGIEPDEISRLAAEAQVAIHLRLEIGSGPERLEASVRGLPAAARLPTEPRTWRSYANDPLRRFRAQALGNELDRFLRARLPSYMIPGAIVLLDAMPLSANGKVDRSALPEPAGPATSDEAHSGIVARTHAEEVVLEIWKQVFALTRLSIHDNFFAVGGNSLMATQVLSRIRECLSVELPLREVFEKPTVAELAAAIEERRRSGREEAWSMPLVPVDRETLPPLSYAQHRMWFLQELDRTSGALNLSTALRLSGHLDLAVLERSFFQLVERHEVLRTRFPVLGSVPVQVVDPAVRRRMPRIDLGRLESACRDSEGLRLALQAATQPFDLSAGGLLRVRLLRVADDEHLLSISMHHIVADGWSIGVIQRDLAAFYEAFASGRPSPLAKLPIQYIDYSQRQREWLSGERLHRFLDYWRKCLGGELPVLRLPSRAAPPPVPRFLGAAEQLHLSPTLRRRLRELCRRHDLTPFIALAASFRALLHLYSAQEDILIGTNVANREHPLLEGLVGDFVNTVVLRGEVTGRTSFRQLLAREKELVLEAFAHQEIPIERVIAELRPDHQGGYGRLFQAMFVFQNFPLHVRELSDLSFAPIELEQRTTNFDLTLFMSERGERLAGVFIYDADLFDSATMARMAQRYAALLEAMVGDSEREIGDATLGEEKDIEELADAFNIEL